MGDTQRTSESVSFIAQRDAARADPAVLAKLLQRAAPAVRRAIRADLPRRWRHLLSDDDVLQQAFVDAFRDFLSFSGDSFDALKRWQMRIAKRNLLDAIRALEAEKRGGGRPTISADPQQSCLDLLQMLTASITQPSRAVGRADAADAIRAAVAGLPPRYRTVIEAYDLDGREMGDIADEIGLSRGAAYMLRVRALRLLRQQLGDTTRFFSATA